MNRQFHNKWQSLTVTNKHYSTDQKNVTGHLFNIKLEEKSYKMSFKTLLVKIQRSKNPPLPGQIFFLCFTACLVNVNNLGTTMCSILATRKSCGNKRFSNQHWKPDKITSQVSVLMIEYLVTMFYELWMVQYVLYFWL